MLEKSQTSCGVSGPVTSMSVTPVRQEESFFLFFPTPEECFKEKFATLSTAALS